MNHINFVVKVPLNPQDIQYHPLKKKAASLRLHLGLWNPVEIFLLTSSGTGAIAMEDGPLIVDISFKNAFLFHEKW